VIEKNRRFLAVAGLLLFPITFGSPSLAANLPPAKGGQLPPIKLQIPKDPGEKRYLELSGSGFFQGSADQDQNGHHWNLQHVLPAMPENSAGDG